MKAQVFLGEHSTLQYSRRIGEIQAVLAQVALPLGFVPRADGHFSVVA